MTKQNFWKPAAVLLVTAAVLIFYFVTPPGSWYLSCPFREITGWQCPGCGSQRALHELLHLNVSKAFRHNALFALALPTGLFVFLSQRRNKRKSIASRVFSSNLLWWIAGAVILLFGILRNL